MMNKRRVKKMAVNMRERPKLQGKDLERFLYNAKKNEEFMKNFAAKKVKEYNDRFSKS